MASPTHTDVLVVGAGISGIDAAYHLKNHAPGRSFAVLERRAALGGTWDFFKYPGIRSDSDMFTFGFAWAPWPDNKVIAPADDILRYLRAVVRDHGLARHIEYGVDIRRAEFSSATGLWTLTEGGGGGGEEGGNKVRTCRVLYMCGGYYSYETPHKAAFAGAAAFEAAGGTIVHPQEWTDTVAYAGKRVAVIGSGATAITLVPALAAAGGAAHVTMVQRSPTYIGSVPEADATYAALSRVPWLMPQGVLHSAMKWKYTLYQQLVFGFMRAFPGAGRALLGAGVRKELRGSMAPAEVKKHFTPRYDPWDQRLCASPDGDFFAALRSGACSIVTDAGGIDTFTPTGLRTADGTEVRSLLVISRSSTYSPPTRFPLCLLCMFLLPTTTRSPPISSSPPPASPSRRTCRCRPSP